MNNKTLLIWLTIGWSALTARLIFAAVVLEEWRGFAVTEIQLIASALMLWKLLKATDADKIDLSPHK